MNNFASFRRKIIIIFHSMSMFNVQPVFCIVDTGSCFFYIFYGSNLYQLLTKEISSAGQGTVITKKKRLSGLVDAQMIGA